MSVFLIYVYFRRSCGFLKKYSYISLGLMIVPMLDWAYVINKLPSEQKIASILAYIFVYVMVGLILWYQIRQKKYFNKP
jgi:hypothetical protein